MSNEQIRLAAAARVDATRAAIRARRESLGMTQEQMGERLGLDRLLICKLETGKRGIRVSELCEIAAVLDIDPVELLRGEVR